jgi:hypothetical protein
LARARNAGGGGDRRHRSHRRDECVQIELEVVEQFHDRYDRRLSLLGVDVTAEGRKRDEQHHQARTDPAVPERLHRQPRVLLLAVARARDRRVNGSAAGNTLVISLSNASNEAGSSIDTSKLEYVKSIAIASSGTGTAVTITLDKPRPFLMSSSNVPPSLQVSIG